MSSRIPLELQSVFLASNGASDGCGAVKQIDAIKPPSNRTAFKVFKRAIGLSRRKKHDGTASLSSDTDTSVGSFEPEGIASSLSEKVQSPSIEQAATPQQYLEQLLKARGYNTKRFPVLESSYFNRPTPTQLASYNPKLIDEIIKKQDEDKLQELLSAGLSPNACNAHGESLMHRAARLGYHRQVKIFMDFGAETKMSDSQGRTLLHDTCWGDRPSFQTFGLLVRQDPNLVFMSDSRGACPLNYVRKDHYDFWRDFLDRTVDEFFPPLTAPPTTPQRVLAKPNSHPVPDSANVLPMDIANMLASGRITPKEVIELMSDESDHSVSAVDSYDGSFDGSFSSEDCTYCLY